MDNHRGVAILFSALLDAKLRLASRSNIDQVAQFGDSQLPDEVDFALSLWPSEFSEEAEAMQDVRARLGIRLASPTEATTSFKDKMRSILALLSSLSSTRWKLAQAAVGTVLILLLLQVFHVPVLASLQRLIGYGYAPLAGFVPLDGTMILPRPVVLDTESGGVEIEQIVLTDSTLELWLVSDAENPPPSIAEISMPAGEQPELVDAYRPEVSRRQLHSYWRYRGKFAPSPWIEIRLDGFEIRRIPLQPAVELLAPLQSFRVCDTHAGISVCAIAMRAEAESTCALVEIHLKDQELIRGYPMLVDNPVLPPSVISIRTADGNRATGIPQGPPVGPMKVSGEEGTFLEQLCFPVHAAEEEMILQIPAVEVTVPITNQLHVPVVSQEQGWVEVGQSFDWAGAEITFEQVRAFPSVTDMNILRVLGRQNVAENSPIITTFQLNVRGESGISLSGTTQEPRDPHDARTGLHMIDLWLTHERVEAGPSTLTVRVGYPHLTFVGPFVLSFDGNDGSSNR